MKVTKLIIKGSANYGYCAARKLKYFGYKLVMLSTLEGIPIAYDLQRLTKI